MPDFLRVTDKVTPRREYTIAASALVPGEHEVLEKDALAADGTFLPAKYAPAGLVPAAESPVAVDAPADDEGYAGMTVADLKAEIDARNEGRDGEPLSKSGAKDELVARLAEDDEPALPETPPESLSSNGQTATNQKEQAR